MSFWKTLAKESIKGLVESFASSAGSHIADRLLQKEDPVVIEVVEDPKDAKPASSGV